MRRLLARLKPQARANPDHEFMRRLYADVLRRPASDDEIARYLASGMSQAAHLAAVLKSEEYSASLDAIRGGRADINLNRDSARSFDHVVSIGSHCFTSIHLQRWSLKRWSGPLDWVFSSGAMAAACLRDRFETFLDPRQFVFIKDEDRPVEISEGYCDHEAYRRLFGIKSLFNHRDPRIEDNYKFYFRSAARLNNVLDSGSPILLVNVSVYYKSSEDDIFNLMNAVRERSSAAFLLYIFVHPEDEARLRPHAELRYLTRNAQVLDYFPVSGLGPLSFLDTLDELFVAALIHEFTFELKAKPHWRG